MTSQKVAGSTARETERCCEGCFEGKWVVPVSRPRFTNQPNPTVMPQRIAITRIRAAHCFAGTLDAEPAGTARGEGTTAGAADTAVPSEPSP